MDIITELLMGVFVLLLLGGISILFGAVMNEYNRVKKLEGEHK